MIKITSKEKDLLMNVVDYKILKIDQLAKLNHSGKGIVQRKVSKFYKNGLLNLSPRNNSSNYGRPENIICISEKGVKLLQEENLADNKIQHERFTADKIYNIEHELLINWFRIHLQYFPEKVTDLTADSISATSPFLPLKNNGLSLISEYFEYGRTKIDFIPDGVFYLKSNNQNRSILFFLEVDRGTESLNSRSTKSNNIARKIKNYRAYFLSEKYKRYQKNGIHYLMDFDYYF